MRGNNFRDLIKAEMITRFEDVIKNEINEYRNAQKQIFESFNKINLEIESIKAEVKNLREHIANRCNEVNNAFLLEKKSLEESFEDQRREIRSYCTLIKAHLAESERKLTDHVSKKEHENQVATVDKIISGIQVKCFEDNCIYDEKLFKLQQNVKDFTKKEIETCTEKVTVLLNVLSTYQNKIDTYEVNNQGFLRELGCCKKEAFIQEKKIENLYTLIERLKAGKI